VYTLLTIGWSYIVNKFGTQQLREEVLPAAAAARGSWWPTRAHPA